MTFGQLECPIDETVAGTLSLFLEEEALSSSWYEVNPTSWVFQVLFKEEQESLIREKLTHFFAEKKLSLPTITKSILEDKDWVASVYRDSPPLAIGRFYVYGSHIQDTPPADLIPLHIDAATAFGSGQHESTEGCLKALSLLEAEQHRTRPLDMGCGSGILALGMAGLWKVPVIACDNDPEAVRVTTENSIQNGLNHLIHAEVSEGFSELHNKTFDIITANILAGPLCQMAKDVEHALVPGGFIVLSGLLNCQAEDVIHAYRNVGLDLVNRIEVGEWSTLIMQKKSNG